MNGNGTHRSVASGYSTCFGNWRVREVIDDMHIARRCSTGLLLLFLLTTAGGTGSAHAQAPPASSTLPMVIIDTDGRRIPDEPKIDGEMRIIDNGRGTRNRPSDPATDYDGLIAIEVRGRSSSNYPQRPYLLETRKSDGSNNNVPLLGMPEENDWILVSNYNDKSLVRNLLGFDLFRRMGHYAPRTRLVEVVLNGSYRGVYVFTEAIKQDDGRVDIAKLDYDDVAGDSLTGGYIIQVNYSESHNSWRSSFPPFDDSDRRHFFIYEDPQWDDIQPEQKAYIQQFMHDAQEALYGSDFADPAHGYRQYFDVNSFIDYFIVSEVSRNVDGYKKSRYFHKDRDENDPYLHAGPVWDFDWAWKNIRECIFRNVDGSGWSWQTNTVCTPDRPAPGWYVRLLQDAHFTERLIARYESLRQDVLDLDRIEAQIDTWVASVGDAQERHFALYPIDRDYRAPEVSAPSESYAEEIEKLKDWIARRLGWLDANIPRLRDEIQVPAAAADRPSGAEVQVYPDPVAHRFSVQSDTPLVAIKLYDLLGRETISVSLDGAYATELSVGGLVAGTYLMRIERTGGATIRRTLHVVR